MKLCDVYIWSTPVLVPVSCCNGPYIAVWYRVEAVSSSLHVKVHPTSVALPKQYARKSPQAICIVQLFNFVVLCSAFAASALVPATQSATHGNMVSTWEYCQEATLYVHQCCSQSTIHVHIHMSVIRTHCNVCLACSARVCSAPVRYFAYMPSGWNAC